MKHKTILGCIVIVLGVVASYSIASEEVVDMPAISEVVVVQKTEVEKRTEEIMNSQEFQEEMYKLAESRALFNMSLERQDEAVELSEKAIEAYRISNALANDWKQSHNITN